MRSARFLHFVVLLVLSFSLGCGNKNSLPSNLPDNSAAAGGPSAAPGGTPNDNGSLSAGAEKADAAPQPIVIPAGRAITIRLSEALGSATSQKGQSFSGSVAEPVEIDGQTVIQRGASAHGTVVTARAMGHFKGGALLQLRLDSVYIDGERRPVETALWSATRKGKGKRSTIAIAGGAGLGAALGGIFGGGKGAAIGALAGGGAGTAGAAFTGNKDIHLPAESVLRFTLRRSVEVH